MTGLILHNPAGSGKKLILVDVGFSYTTAPAALHNLGIGLTTTGQVAPTSLTAAGRSAIAADGSGNLPSAVGYDAATLIVAPVAVRWFNGTLATGGVGNYSAIDRIDGSIVVVPGAQAALIALTTTAIGVGHFTWVEVPA